MNIIIETNYKEGNNVTTRIYDGNDIITIILYHNNIITMKNGNDIKPLVDLPSSTSCPFKISDAKNIHTEILNFYIWSPLIRDWAPGDKIIGYFNGNITHVYYKK